MNVPATVLQHQAVSVPTSETAAIINMIERAARDPSVDIDKLRQLLELRERIEARQAERDFDIAMNAAQSEMGRVRADATNPQTKSRYASYPALDRELRPVYTKHGFVLSFNTGDAPAPEMVRVLCRVSKGGYSRDYHIDMPADGKGAKGGDVMTKTHATGSAVSYGMRYLLKMIFNIAVGQDDDGNSAGSGEKVSDEQVAKLNALAAEIGIQIDKYCKYMRVASLADIPAARFADAVAAMETKRPKQ